MSAIANVGELASPYYLLEVWARRDDIDIDPETYASLKAKARRLIRSYRRFDTAGEQPDDDWWGARLDLLGLADAVPVDRQARADLREPALAFQAGLPSRQSAGSMVAERLLVWRDDAGRDALVVADLRDDADPDARPVDAADPVATQFELALDAYAGDADWGLLLAGPRVRVYRRASGISQQYLELDLEALVELDDEPTWKAFAAVFRAPAFAADDGTPPLIRRVVDESRRHASRLAADMRADLVDAAEALLSGALSHPANAGQLGDRGPSTLRQLFEEVLYILYRVLFVLYAEGRDVLPVGGAGPYATTYSVDHLVELVRGGAPPSRGTYLADSLRRLFHLLWEGPTEAARRLGIEPVGGELFDPARTRRLDACIIEDETWGRALRALALGADGSARARLGRRSSFAELGVDQLGSIYEGLLTLEPHLATEPELLVRRDKDGERRVLPATVAMPDLSGYRLLRRLEPGEFVLESASGRRKGSGSFYTPHEITEYLTGAALDPLVAPLVARALHDPAGAERALRALRVCDPAMGSGAFLVQAARVLGRGLARIRAARTGRRVTPELLRQCERVVVRDALYGVDLNPLAVALAKVSLWLETLEPGRPLSFLDAHLRCGDALVGAELAEAGRVTAARLARWPAAAAEGLRRYLHAEAGPAGAGLLEHLKGRKAPRESQHPTLPGLDIAAVSASLADLAAERAGWAARADEAETLEEVLQAQERFESIEATTTSVRNRVRAAADLWCVQWFVEGEDGPAGADGRPPLPLAFDTFHELLRGLLQGDPLPPHRQEAAAAARAVASRRRFFHWALEFPEVILGRGGFDAVVGNPPWNTLSPSDDEFFATYDPVTFRRGVPKPVKDQRKANLRTTPEVDAAWRAEARFLYELSHWAKPESGNFTWYAADGQLRKGDANVFRLFVERAVRLLRPGGRLGQVLPDSLYISSPATGLRQHLLTDGQLERCYVFENRRELFPIHRSTKVVLLVATAGGGPTERFRTAFFVGKDAAGRERAVSLEDLPAVLARLDAEAPELTVDQVRALAPETWAFPELQTALDAEIATQCAATVPPLNLDDRGWGLRYCAELHADRDAWRFHDAEALQARGAVPIDGGLRWRDPEGFEWWPLVEGATFYHLEFPAAGHPPAKWVNGREVAALEARRNPDGTSVMEHYRVAWRDVASATNERSAIAAVLPPRCAAKHTSPTSWGGALPLEVTLGLAALVSSVCFDYLLRFGGKTHLTHAVLSGVPAPPSSFLRSITPIIAEVVCRSADYADLWRAVRGQEPMPELDPWQVAERRAELDAAVALAYGLSLRQFAAVLSTFPNVDRSQPMLPGEPKCFVTRDLALLAYCRRTDVQPMDLAHLLAEAGVRLPAPVTELRRLDVRVVAYRALGAVPYRPTPRGGRTPTDPALVEEVLGVLSVDGMSAAEVAEAVDEDPSVVARVLKGLAHEDRVFAEGRGRDRRYYVLEEA